MDRKDIFRHAREFIGGKPEVYAYYNSDESKNIDIMTSRDSEYVQVDVHSTIGLFETDIGLTIDGKRIGTELIVVGDKADNLSGNILATVSFEIMDSKECYLGQIIPNVIEHYSAKGEMKHVILLSPVFWKRYEPYENENTVVVWLLLVPVSDTEKNYIESYGVDAFEKVLMQQKSDITDRKRSSFV